MGQPAKNLLRIHNLRITYRQDDNEGVPALDGVSLDVNRGEVLGIIGESGCGKSTLANAVLGLLPPQTMIDGEIWFGERDLLRLSQSELRQILGRELSLIPQEPALWLNPVLKVQTQISEVLRAHLPMSRKQRHERVTDLLHEVGFDQPARICDAYPHQLSGGERQRVVIAQALACDPTLLIADEPTTKLDAPLRLEIVDLLSKVRATRDMTILFIGHDLMLLSALADRVAVMYAGRLVEIGTLSEVFRRPLHPYMQALRRLAQSSFEDAAAAAEKELPIISEGSSNPVRTGCMFEARCPERMAVCVERPPQEVAPEPQRSVSCFKYGG